MDTRGHLTLGEVATILTTPTLHLHITVKIISPVTQTITRVVADEGAGQATSSPSEEGRPEDGTADLITVLLTETITATLQRITTSLRNSNNIINNNIQGLPFIRSNTNRDLKNLGVIREVLRDILQTNITVMDPKGPTRKGLGLAMSRDTEVNPVLTITDTKHRRLRLRKSLSVGKRRALKSRDTKHLRAWNTDFENLRIRKISTSSLRRVVSLKIPDRRRNLPNRQKLQVIQRDVTVPIRSTKARKSVNIVIRRRR